MGNELFHIETKFILNVDEQFRSYWKYSSSISLYFSYHFFFAFEFACIKSMLIDAVNIQQKI